MAKQSHGLRISIGSLKPGSGQARNIATGNSGSGTSHNMNTSGAKTPHGPRQSATQPSSGHTQTPGANVTRVEGKIRRGGSDGYAAGKRPQQPGRNSVRKPS